MTYKDVSFWNKINHTIQLFGTGGQVALALNHVSPVWNIITGGATILAMVFAIWMDDKDNNGKVDLFEKEVTIKVTSDAPIQTEVKTETKEP